MNRIFIAIRLPEKLCSDLLHLTGGIPGCRWSKREQIHLTLRFVGEVNDTMLLDIKDALQGVEAEEFSLNLDGVGFFPPGKSPRVLWAGISKSSALISLQKKIQKILRQDCAIPEEGRTYHPHVTLARVRSVAHLDKIIRWLQTFHELKSEPFSVSSFCLFRSHLNPEGVRYELLQEYSLSCQFAGDSVFLQMSILWEQKQHRVENHISKPQWEKEGLRQEV
jgi:2'-5' RNA ligase